MDVFQGMINRIHINVPTRTKRNYQLLYIKYHRSNYANNDPFRRLCLQFNKYYHNFDFSDNKDSLKGKIILYLNN